jgi:hypothetical protein
MEHPMPRLPQQTVRKPSALSTVCFGFGFASIAASIGTWAAARGNDTAEEKAHAERFGIFVGLWAPTFFILADLLARRGTTFAGAAIPAVASAETAA